MANPILISDERNMIAMRTHMIAAKIFLISHWVLFLNDILNLLTELGAIRKCCDLFFAFCPAKMYLIISRGNKTVNFKEKLISGKRIAMLILLDGR